MSWRRYSASIVSWFWSMCLASRKVRTRQMIFISLHSILTTGGEEGLAGAVPAPDFSVVRGGISDIVVVPDISFPVLNRGLVLRHALNRPFPDGGGVGGEDDSEMLNEGGSFDFLYTEAGSQDVDFVLPVLLTDGGGDRRNATVDVTAVMARPLIT